MAEIVKLAKVRRLRNGAAQGKPKPSKALARPQDRNWQSFSARAASVPLVAELQSGVLAFRRDGNGEPLVLLISKRRSKKWGIPKGRAEPHLSLHENAAKEAFEEAGVIGHIAPASVGVFCAEKATADPLRKRVIEVWVYLLEVTEELPDWPEKARRTTRWVRCETAARHLREPVLVRLCHRLAETTTRTVTGPANMRDDAAAPADGGSLLGPAVSRVL
jgi:8-oxo-dGTP pyrophosphatase MutT (NUDIX family)